MTDQSDPIDPFVPAPDPAEQLTRRPHHRLVLALAPDEADQTNAAALAV